MTKFLPSISSLRSPLSSLLLNRYFGVKFLLSLLAVVAVLWGAAARPGARTFFDWSDAEDAGAGVPGEDDYGPAPPDTPGVPAPRADSPTAAQLRLDSLRRLRFPLTDYTGNPATDGADNPFDLADPSNIEHTVEYNPEDGRYYLYDRVGGELVRNPSYLTYEEYYKYQSKTDEQDYWRRRLDALSLFNGKPEMPPMYKQGLFDRLFGGSTGTTSIINVRPQGNIDVTAGFVETEVKNPALTQRQQNPGATFDFDLQMNINLLAVIGDKLKLNISNNTKATFDYQNIQRLEYVGKEDEIIKKIEAGNIGFPLRSSLVTGVQSLFGLKTQLQFGRLWMTNVLSQQKSKRQTLTIQGGAQTQQYAIKADDYEENRHFLLGQYFRNNYNRALKNYPVISSLVTINKIEVWVTNRTGAVEGVRDVMGFMDLGERAPYRPFLTDPSVADDFPANRANALYPRLLQNPQGRQQGQANRIATSLGLEEGADFQRVTARKLLPSEYTYNPQLGYLSLNATPNPDDIVCVAYRYTYNGKVFQVGEFAEDLPPDSTNQSVIYLKLLKGTSPRVTLPIWDLMMKNIYALGGFGLSREDFKLNVLYQDPGGGEKRFIPEGPAAGVPLLNLLNLDRLNFNNDPNPDGIFDFVEGFTINSQQGKVIFPVLEPFGQDLAPALGTAPQIQRKYLYSILYDSTKTVARQFQQSNRYVIKGSYRSASSSEIFLNAFNIPQGSVSVTAGGQVLVEGQDYQIDYGIGRLKILNTGLLLSGQSINVAYEDAGTFGFQQQNFIGSRWDYYLNDAVTLGGTFMRLTERPFTQKVEFGEDPIRNTVLGLDVNYQAEAPYLTRLLDKLPLYSTTATSYITATAEGAALLPGHPRQIDFLDGGAGAVYIDNFEGTRSSYDLRQPAQGWTLASTPLGARDRTGALLFPEAALRDSLPYGRNRAKLAWYFIEPTLVDGGGNGVPDYVKKDPAQHYIRLIQQQEVFPQRSINAFNSVLGTLDLSYYPRERGQYNFDTDVAADGRLNNPRRRWGGIQRPIENSDFEQSNVEFLEFWVMDPFINNPGAGGGQLYIHLGNVSEDVLKDSRKAFENGIPFPKDLAQLDRTKWGYVPRFQQQITRAFDNSNEARAVQDVGYDGLTDEEERQFFASYLSTLETLFGTNSAAYQEAFADPSNDNYAYFRDNRYAGDERVLARYKRFNGSHGNSPVNAGGDFSFAATNIPEGEDINRDNTLNESEDYFQYRVEMRPNMQVGSNFIVNRQETTVKLPNGNSEGETWYQFKIPIREFGERVGGISDFRSIRFIRMFLTGFEDSVVMRFARLELGRNTWRRYMFSLTAPGENIPEDDLRTTEFNVTSVSFEENAERDPVPYVIPPGVDRQQTTVANNQSIQLNEQSLALQVCGLKDGDARAVFREVGVDMRQFDRLRMFMHAESYVGQAPVRNGDLRAIIRIGSDFTNNYYEYQVPLQITAPNSRDANLVWPEANRVDLDLEALVAAKAARNAAGIQSFVPYSTTDEAGNTIIVVGNPNIGDAKTMLLGILNPKRRPVDGGQDDGMEKCAEVWFNELRATGLNETPGYAATAKLAVQLADLGSLRAGGSMHTQGYGSIDQKLNQRRRDNFYQYDASTNINAGKLLPRTWGLQLPLFVGYSESVSNPQFDPYDLDIKLKDKLRTLEGPARDSARKAAQDFTGIASFNISNVRFLGNPDRAAAGGAAKPWSLKNFDLNYSLNRQFKRNPLVSSDELENQRLGAGYTYAFRNKPVEPFRKLIKSRSKWLSPIKDFNFNYLPANIGIRSELARVFNETYIRPVGGDGEYVIPPLYFSNFTWVRTYNLRWELTRSLSFDYNATNNSRIDEPYGRIDNAEKRDTVLGRLLEGGRNTYFTQNFNAAYTLPLQKFPFLDWTNARLTYGSTYSWTTASLLAKPLGNTIANTQNRGITGELNFVTLYNKQRWLRAVNQPKPRAANSPAGGRREAELRGGPGKDKGDVVTRERDPRGADPDEKNGQYGRGVEAAPVVASDAPADRRAPGSDRGGKREDSVLIINNAPVVIAGMGDAQVDSLRKVAKAQDRAKSKADKKKKRLARRAARKARRAKTPQVSGAERFAGRLATALKRVTANYTENSGTVLPGYLDSTRVLGVNPATTAPGLDFVYGYQPGREWLYGQANGGRLSTDPLFNGLFQQQYSQTLNMTAQVEPFADFRIDLTLTQTFSKNHAELFKDTSTGLTAGFTSNSPFQTGAFNISYLGIRTLFDRQPDEGPSPMYGALLAARPVVSNRLGGANPYTGTTPDPTAPEFQKGYTEYSQDVLIPSFVAAYTGRDAATIPLINSRAQGTRANPFGGYLPLPNWRITYNGLSKIQALQNVVQNIVVNHSYSGTLGMNSFVSNLLYQDAFGLGFPSFIDSNSGNYVPFFQVPNVTISEQFGPLAGFDAQFRNALTARFEYRRSRTTALSLIDYQVAETNSSEFVVGAGYRVRGLRLPFAIAGLRTLKNDLNLKVDVGIRDDRTTNTFLAGNASQDSRGQRVVSIAPSADYIISDKLTLRLFYDRRSSKPYTTQSFPITNSRGGVTLRFIFAQ